MRPKNCPKCGALLDTPLPVSPAYPACPPEHKALFDPKKWAEHLESWRMPHQPYGPKKRTSAAIRQKRYREGHPEQMAKSKKRLAKRLKEEVGMQTNEYAKAKSARNMAYLKLSILRDQLKKNWAKKS